MNSNHKPAIYSGINECYDNLVKMYLGSQQQQKTVPQPHDEPVPDVQPSKTTLELDGFTV